MLPNQGGNHPQIGITTLLRAKHPKQLITRHLIEVAGRLQGDLDIRLQAQAVSRGIPLAK
jgi:hypothetical protein